MINVGVIGCGYWGPKLLRNFYELPQSSIKMVSDLSLERLSTMVQLYGNIFATTDYHYMLESRQIDAVCIATPIRTHYKIAKEALLAGKHVLVEKPLTASSASALELCELAERNGLTLMVGHTFEYNPAVEKLREILQSGELGDIYYIDSARLNLGLFQKDISVLWDLAPHDFSIINYLLGDADPLVMSARGGAHLIPNIYDVVFVEARYPANLLANIHISWLDPCKVRRTTVVGSKKMAVFNDVAEAEKIRLYHKNVTLPQENGDGQYIDFKPSYFAGDITIPRIAQGEPLKIQCQHFLDSIATGKKPRTDGRVGLKVVRMLEWADRMLQTQHLLDPRGETFANTLKSGKETQYSVLTAPALNPAELSSPVQ